MKDRTPNSLHLDMTESLDLMKIVSIIETSIPDFNGAEVHADKNSIGMSYYDKSMSPVFATKVNNQHDLHDFMADFIDRLSLSNCEYDEDDGIITLVLSRPEARGPIQVNFRGQYLDKNEIITEFSDSIFEMDQEFKTDNDVVFKLCAFLKENNIKSATREFIGGGDSGDLGELYFIVNGQVEHAPLITEQALIDVNGVKMSFSDVFEDFVNDKSGSYPDWWNDDGGSGWTRLSADGTYSYYVSQNNEEMLDFESPLITTSDLPLPFLKNEAEKTETLEP